MNLRTLLLSLTCLLFSKLLFAQTLVDDTKTYEVLVFENVEKEQTRFIRNGGRIKYSLYNNPKKVYKGTLQKITNTSMFVDGQEVKISDCSMIAGRVRTDKELIGGLLLGIGVATAPFGVAIISLNDIVGPVLAGAGIAAVVTGIYFITQKKKFKMARGWTVHGGKLTFSMTQN